MQKQQNEYLLLVTRLKTAEQKKNNQGQEALPSVDHLGRQCSGILVEDKVLYGVLAAVAPDR